MSDSDTIVCMINNVYDFLLQNGNILHLIIINCITNQPNQLGHSDACYQTTQANVSQQSEYNNKLFI